MKILIISYFFPPLNSVASLRPYTFAKTYARMGHQVTVLTANKPSNQNDLLLPIEGFKVVEVRSQMLDWFYAFFNINSGNKLNSKNRGGKFRRLLNSARIKRGLLVLGRLPDLFDLLIGPTKKAAGDQHWDLVISTYAPRYCHAVAEYLRVRGLADCWVSDYRDLWTQHHFFGGIFPFTILEKYLEQRYLLRADFVSTVSKGLAQRLSNIAQNKEVYIAPNGFDQDDLDNMVQESIFFDKKIRLVYTGTIYAEGLYFQSFLEALKLTSKAVRNLCDRLEVLFAGTDMAELQAQTQKLGLGDLVKFCGVCTREDSLRMQRDADILLFFDYDVLDVPTTKLYEYISSGTFIWRIGSGMDSVAKGILSLTRTGIDLGADSAVICQEIENLLVLEGCEKFESLPLEIAKYERGYIAGNLLEHVLDRGA